MNVTSGEESKKLRVEYARVPLKDKAHAGWMRYVKVENNQLVLYAQPWVNRKLSDEEQKKRAKQKEQKHQTFVKRLEENRAKKLKALEQKKKVMELKIKERALKLEAKLTELKSNLA